MKQFFKFMLASMAGFILTMLIMWFIAFIFIASVISVASKKEVVIEPNSILHLTLNQPIPERSPAAPFAFSSSSLFKTTNTPGLLETLDLISKASEDANISGIYLDLSDIPSGLATLEEVRNALLEFKKSGKFIYAYGEIYSQKAYYLSTVADQIIVNPEGAIDFKGLTGQVVFLKGLLDKLEINAQIIRHGKFKSAIEPFISDKMSEANKEQTITYIGSIWDHMVDGISQARKIDKDMLKRAADSLWLQTAEDAVEMRFADQAAYKDQVITMLKSKVGLQENDKLKLVTLNKYRDQGPIKGEKRSKNKIAVIYAVGTISGGDGSDEAIGSDRISKAIRKARLDSTIKAIVFRINSPGGSALASDVIWREVKLASEAKPLIASMGDLAASGGYYIACAADTIIANPTTLTGSIGVFGIVPDMQKFFNNKLGVTFDKVETNENSDFLTVTRPMTPYEEKVLTNQIERIYSTFIGHVAEGRSMLTADVDSIGQGRVWSGIDGLRIKLVDDTGGLKKSIELAATMANISGDYRTISLPEQKDPFTQIMEDLKGNDPDAILKEKLGVFYSMYKEVEAITSMDRVQARMPYSIEIE
ncbi:MAG TPA: signal peptide peptidase SppA [Lentimicrobium sp.]|nr:signal peptide peptidase SppA [Lentimicrobium sp.]